MIPGLHRSRVLLLSLAALISSCSGNIMQTTVFEDFFQEMAVGMTSADDLSDPAIYFDADRGRLGEWTVASSLRQEGFNQAWQIRSEAGEKYLAQTFTNLTRSNTPLSLITHPLIVAGDSLWNDYTLDVEFTPLAKFDKCGVVFRFHSTTNFLFFGVEGNTVTLKHINPPVTPLRPIERILDYRPLVWTPGERLHATVTVRREKVSAIMNDSIILQAENLPLQSGRIGLISDLPARFHSVEVKVLKGEQRKLSRRKRQQERREELILGDSPEMVRWKRFETGSFGTDQNLRMGDLNGDGNKEILFVRPSADSSAELCITAMNLEGEILWQYGDPGRGLLPRGEELPVQVHDLDGDGDREVIFFGEGSIYMLEGISGKVLRRVRLDSNLEVGSISFGDLMGIGRDNCMVLSDRTSHLVVMNERFEPMWERETSSGAEPLVHDMNGDGRQEVLMGYSVFDPDGNLMYDVGAFIGDDCNGVTVHQVMEGERMTPCLIYAAGDWGLMYFDFNGNLLKQNVMGNVQYLTLADFDSELPGLEIATSNRWGSNGLVHLVGSSGTVLGDFLVSPGVSRCLPVNWKGDGEEFMLISADSISGGMVDRLGQPAVRFPSDGHPVSCYAALDLTGDTRDEVVVWDERELWIYTQSDNPRMGKTYAPDRNPIYNWSMYQMNRSLPGW